jgi:hypothetical protein
VASLPGGPQLRRLVVVAALWAVVSVFLPGPVSWLVGALAAVAHSPAAASSRVFVGVVDALVYSVAAFAYFALAGRRGPSSRYVLAALIGYLLGQAGYLGMGWLVDGGTASLSNLDPALMFVEAAASTLGAAGAVGVWSAQRDMEEGPRD